MTTTGHFLTIDLASVTVPQVAMAASGFTLTAYYVRHLAAQLAGMGVPVDEWLARCGLDENKLLKPELAVSFSAFRQLVQDALALAREPALGLLVGERLVASAHGILGYAAQQSGSVRQALELLARYTGVRIALVSVAYEVRGREALVRFTPTQPLGDIERPLLEAMMLSIKNVLTSISMGECQPQRAVFGFAAPGYAALARELFGCPVRYDEPWSGLVLAAACLDRPLRLADPEAFRAATEICQRELDRLAQSETLAAKVQRLLLEKQQGFPSLQTTARLVHLTPRTLHRRLLAEGTSFRALLEGVRRTLAVEQLKSGHFGIQEIAYKLGYSDLANFRRAFKRWEKMPPSQVRAAHAPAADASADAAKRPPRAGPGAAAPRRKPRPPR